jgi:hypothetical protein
VSDQNADAQKHNGACNNCVHAASIALLALSRASACTVKAIAEREMGSQLN